MYSEKMTCKYKIESCLLFQTFGKFHKKLFVSGFLIWMVNKRQFSVRFFNIPGRCGLRRGQLINKLELYDKFNVVKLKELVSLTYKRYS